MLGRQKPKASLFQMVTVEELVPPDHFLRQLDAALDFSFIRERVRPLYSEDNGRPSVDPELALRMFLLSFLFDISENRLADEIGMHAGYRWFCRLDFHDPVPDRSTLVKIRRERWGPNGVFADVLRQVVQACVDAGLVSADVLAVDGTLVDARAATRSLEPIHPAISLEEYLHRVEQNDRAEEVPPTDEPPTPTSSGGATTRKAGDPNFRGERFTNATHRSKTDPDARLYAKGNHQEAKLRFMVHTLMDTRSCVILDTRATRCSGTAEPEAALEMLAGVEGFGLDPSYLLADGHYTAGAFLKDLIALGMEPLVPIRGDVEPLPQWKRRTNRLDYQRRRSEKLAMTAARNQARMLRDSALYRKTYSLRTRLEHRHAEAKQRHGLDRARGYGLLAMEVQAQLTATVLNLKRLV